MSDLREQVKDAIDAAADSAKAAADWVANKSKETTETLRDALRAAGPRLDFTLLYLTPPDQFDPSWRTEGIEHRAVRQPEPYTWKGDDTVWETLLRDAGALS